VEILLTVEMLQTWHGHSLFHLAEGRRHQRQCLRHPRDRKGLLRECCFWSVPSGDRRPHTTGSAPARHKMVVRASCLLAPPAAYTSGHQFLVDLVNRETWRGC
jgi:hypothetical protein